MKPLGIFFQEAFDFLKHKGVDAPRRTLEDYLSAKLHLDRLSFYTQADRPIDEASLTLDIERLADGEPLIYILGETSFLGCRLKITPDVLIPRQETELMAAWILKTVKKKSGLLVDLCTGSGCLGIALKKHLPSFEVILADLSERALGVAEENAVLNKVDVTIVKGNFLDPLQGQKIDVLVSNPPYISQSEYDQLDRSVKHYEPKMALLGGEDGLFFYQKLSQELPSLMDSEGEVFLEIGSSQGKSVAALFSPPLWKGTIVERDLASHERFLHSLKS